MSIETSSFASSDSTRLMHGVGHQAVLEKRRIKNATKSFVFLLGASALIAAIMFDGAEGIGSSFISGTGIITSDGPVQSQQKSSLLTSIPPLMFFFSMGFGLILTFYVSHRILLRLEGQHSIFSNASDRPHEIKELVAGFDRLRKNYDKAVANRQMLIKKLPNDPETAFAQIVSAGVHKELLAHKKSLRYFPKKTNQQDVVTGELARKSDFPDHIETRESGMLRIAEIKDAMRPFAVLAVLDAIPPKDEE